MMTDKGATPGPKLPADSHVGRIFLRVRDLQQATDFYRTALGLQAQEEAPGGAVLGVPGRGIVGLIESPEALPAPRSPGLYHLAILLPDRPTLGAFLRHTVQARTRLQGASDHGVSEAIYLADPEGNGIEVYRDRKSEEWPRSESGVEMITAPLDARGVLAAAPPPAGAFRAPAGTVLGHVHLQVGDVERAAVLFRDVIGFEVTQSGYPGALFLAAGGYHHHIGLNSWSTARRPPPPAGSLGLAWFEIAVPDPAARAALEERLAAHSTAEESREAFPARIYRDGDGIGVAVVGG